MSKRTVKQIIPAQRINMGGHLLDQPLPFRSVDQIDPFLLIHHWDKPIKAGGNQKELGVGPHPHRGFSPVTFIFKGSVRHQDSIGNNVVVSDGGTQWMHAGKGIVHSERPGIDLVLNGGEQEFIQFWVNTPGKHKMEAPYYLPLSEEETPKIELENTTIGVVAGSFMGVLGPAKTYSPQTLLRIDASSACSIEIPLPKHYNTLLYLLKGGLSVENEKVSSKTMIWYKNDGDMLTINISEASQFIILSGEPIGEPVVSYGPFVMNKHEELQQAVSDFQDGKMGDLIETFAD
ncbi:MAG: pirin family protein [Crocinitomicaceae bacterium]|jgi:redox-sensitive bicupin YhaK (pirin superfamily)|nr:pirin family protein [Crocinitomicaceae bacterium]